MQLVMLLPSITPMVALLEEMLDLQSLQSVELILYILPMFKVKKVLENHSR